MDNSETKTIRIRIDTVEQPRPVVFNYRQLYKREIKKHEAVQDLPKDMMPPTLDAKTDDFYEELLKKAEAYAMVDDNDDEGDEEEEANASELKKGDEYDYEDPFIDDSEMLLDEPYEYSAPEFDGFFVYHGPLDGHDVDDKKTTPKRKTATKPKASASTTTTKRTTSQSSTDKSRKKTTEDAQEKKIITTAVKTSSTTDKPKKTSTVKTTAVTLKPTTSKPTTIKRTSSVTEQTNKKKKKLDEDNKVLSSASSSTTVEEGDKKKKALTPPVLKPLDPEIELLMEKLRRDVKFESFENKAKFPLSLKPTVLEIGLLTFRKQKSVDDNLVHHLMSVLPYNRFTLKKFLTTKSGQMRVDELQQEIDELAILLKQTIDRMMPEQKRLFNEKVAQAQASSENTNTEEEDTPTPKFKCNDEVRKILYDIIQTEEQSIHIANQVALHKDNEKKPEGLASDNKARKLMYQRLLSCWPEGWMNSYEMSRQYSQYKTKMSSLTEKKAATSNIPNTPKANIISVDNNNKKRKRVTDDNHSKKMADIGSNKSTPELPNSQKPKLPSTPNNVITIDTDDDSEEPIKPWNKSNSMKIESLISGPSQKK